MKKYLALVAAFIIISFASAQAAVTILTPLGHGSTYGGNFYIPLNGTFNLALGGMASMAGSTTTYSALVGLDGIPVLGGTELDVNLTNSGLGVIEYGKTYGFKLTKEVSVGFWLSIVKYDSASKTTTILGGTTPVIYADVTLF